MEQSSSRVPPEHMPDEMWLKIFTYLEPAELRMAAQVCQTWGRLVGHSQTLWRDKCFSIPDPSLRQQVLKEKLVENKSWKDAFRDNYGANLIKRQWLSGKFSQFASASDVPTKVFCKMTAETWGEIFERELGR